MRGIIGKWLDGAAIGASILCLIHCLGLPLLIAASPALTARFDVGEAFHLIVLLLAIPTSAFTLIEGWRRHRWIAPLFVGGVGLVLMASGLAFGHMAIVEIGMTVAGSLLLAGAHVANWRGRRMRAAAVIR